MILEAVMIASFYAEPFLGRKTASGEIFVSYKMTAAMPEYRGKPYYVQVQRGKRKLRVRVNDRCPLKRIDLSPAAAKYLGVDGIARVSVRRIPGAK